MKTNTDFKAEETFALLLIGQPLSGKTNVAMSFDRPLFFSTDRKLANAVSRFPGKEFRYVYPFHAEDGTELKSEAKWHAIHTAIRRDGIDPWPRTLVIDNLSDISDALIDHIVSVDGTKITRAGVKCMEMSHWAPYKSLMQRLILVARSLGKMLVVCCHEKEDMDGVTGILTYKPLVGGQLRDNLGSMFTDVWRCETKMVQKSPQYPNGVQYLVRTTPTSRIALGNSVGLPSEFEFTWDAFIAARAKLSPPSGGGN